MAILNNENERLLAIGCQESINHTTWLPLLLRPYTDWRRLKSIPTANSAA